MPKFYTAKWISRRQFIRSAFVLGAGGLFVPNALKAATGTAYMTNSGGLAQSLLNKVEVKRKFLTLNGSFSVLRIGIRCSVNGTSLPGGATSFMLGAQSGTSTGLFSAFPTNGLYGDQVGGSWSFLGSGTTGRYSPLSYHATVATNPSTTDSSAFGSLMMIVAKTNSGAPCMCMTELTVGSPNWTVKVFMPTQNGTPASVDHTTFMNVMSNSGTPTLTGYVYNQTATPTSNAFAFSQAAGTVDTATYGWLQTVPLEVVDFAVTYSP